MSIKRLKTPLCLALLSAVCLSVCAIFAGCGQDDRTPDIVVTGYAQYDWTRQILGENPGELDVKYLLDNGVDLHNYQPSVQDIASIGACKLFIYTDSDAEQWIGGALKNPKNTDRKVLNLISLLSKDEKIALDEDSGHVHDENCVHEYDEHIWLSLKLAKKFVPVIAERLGQIDPDNAALYQANADLYGGELDALDTDFELTISAKTQKKVLVADRYPFVYLMRDYGIEAAAAFSGCAAVTEMSVQKVTELKAYLRDNRLGFVLTLENSNTGIADQIIAGTDAQIRVLHSMQSVTTDQLALSYRTVMRNNLGVLAQVLV
ncbi:MAG: metal ABC transporter substrate-binding protein [Clostridiales bacterium]|jgi:zinc transport system substrate-binding protein|nr:metal ABC transporter substrate-binding protein [Clostridiales bacterium]